MFYEHKNLTVPALSNEEKRWVFTLQKVLAKCPDRLELMITGDASVTIVDAAGARWSGLSDGDAERDGVALGFIAGKPTIHGVSA